MYLHLVELLSESGETIYQLSKKTGISQTAFSNWKSGRNKPNVESLKKIAEHFNVPIEYFLEKGD